MTKKLLSLFFILFATTITACFTSCSSDDDDVTTPTTDTVREAKIDQLLFFQENLVSTDEDGNLILRKNGEPLTEFNSDTTVVYIGAADLDTAKTMFKSWLYEETKYIEVGDKITASPVDTLGNAQGTITFAPVSDDEGKLLATITFSDGASVPHVSQINIIREEAWPHNSTSTYEIGNSFESVVPSSSAPSSLLSSGLVEWMCIKRATKGSKGILMGITYKKGSSNVYLYYNATKSDASTISEILQDDWDFYADIWKAHSRDGKPIKETEWLILSTGKIWKDAIQLGTGKIDDFYFWESYRHLLVCYFD